MKTNSTIPRKALQNFKSEDLKNKMSTQEIAEFLESFRILSSSIGHSESKLISLKVPTDLLKLFRSKTEIEGIKYQTKIKELMRLYVFGKN
ncbi:MAG: hypothetical protein ACK5P5_06940 [Pseudobdellovibrionaceae bacterium]